MYCGESGSTLRFLLPVMGALGRKASFRMEGRLPQRPLSPLYEELERYGCKLSRQGDNPLTIEGQLQPGAFRIPGNVSSQFISGLLFATPLLSKHSQILVEGPLESAPYVDMTIRTLRAFGIKLRKTEVGFFIPGGQRYTAPETYQVEGDWSNACFFLAAGAILDGGVRVTGLKMDSLQGDKAILKILDKMGAIINVEEDAVSVTAGRLEGTEIDASQIPDMVPILAVLASAAKGITTIYGAGRLRIKESDRLCAITQVLTALGGGVRELPDGLMMQGVGRLKGGTIDAHNDHRIAMMAAIASLISDEKVIIKGADAVNKSFPTFFDVLKEAGLDDNIETIT